MATFNKWQKFEITYLIENYSLYTEEDIKYIAETMNKTQKAVAEKLQELYCRKVVDKEYEKEKFRPWLYEDNKFLKDNWGKLDVELIERYLNRSFKALRARVCKLGISSPRNTSNYLSIEQFGKLIGKSYSTVRGWVDEQDFPVILRKVQRNTFLYVNVNKFWEWAESHKEFVVFNKIEKNIIPDEPAWVDEQREIERKFRAPKAETVWSKEEVDTLIKLLKKNKYTYKELSEMLNRSEQAIKRKMIKTNITDRPVEEKKTYLTKDQVNKIIDYYNQEYSITRIAKLLNVRETTIGNKVQKLKKKGILKYIYK